MEQRYISNELTHFVGRSFRSEFNAHEKQYRLMVSILRSGSLGRKVEAPPLGASDQKFSDNEFYRHNLVCFSDIPVPDLGLHMGKFSRFGLAFEKSFLIRKGANPVFYVARNARALDPGDRERLLWELFEQNHEQLWRLFASLGAAEEKEGCEVAPGFGTDKVKKLFDFLVRHVFSFVKFYDEGLLADDMNNFYMEREWRILGTLDFELSDVRRVIFPEKFARSFRRDAPEYFGEITFS